MIEGRGVKIVKLLLKCNSKKMSSILFFQILFRFGGYFCHVNNKIVTLKIEEYEKDCFFTRMFILDDDSKS